MDMSTAPKCFILLAFIQPINIAYEITKEKHQVDLKEGLYGFANDPRTANAPQIGPQLIPDRK